MTKQNYKKRGVYGVVTYQFQKENGQIKAYERCEFVDALKTKHYSEATFIIDFEERRLIKDRTKQASYTRLLSHLEESHPSEYKQIMDLLAERESSNDGS